MKKVFPFILLTLLFNCDSDEDNKPLKFEGQVFNGGVSSPTPLANVTVEITYLDRSTNFIKSDEVGTDESGHYSFSENDPSIKQYWLGLKHDYWYPCNGLFQPSPVFVLPEDVDRAATNFDEINVCMTGGVKLVFTKQTPTAKDTLSYSWKIGMISIYPTKIFASKEIKQRFFSDKVSSIDYEFTLKKENGDVVKWTITETIEPEVTKEVRVNF